MLSARAYSFRQKSRLAISLSSVGGYVNLVALLACGAVVSHVTGNATRVGEAMGNGRVAMAVFFLFLIGAFFIGAVVSALMTESARRRGKASKYVWPMALEAALLLLFAIGSGLHGHVEPDELGWQYALTGIACMAMGLQNATITRISGSTVRTTHVTGVVTDLGIESVQFGYWWLDRLRGRWAQRAGRLVRISQRHPTFLRLLLLASILGSFLLGATLGTFVFLQWPSVAMLPPITFLVFIIGMDLYRPIADVRELDLLSDPELKAGGIIKSMLPPELGIYRFVCGARGTRRSHRAPDFQSWVEHLPEHWRVVILAVNPQTQFDTNAVLDLQAAITGPPADPVRSDSGADALARSARRRADDGCVEPVPGPGIRRGARPGDRAGNEERGQTQRHARGDGAGRSGADRRRCVK